MPFAGSAPVGARSRPGPPFALIIWWWSSRTQSPYVAAKALVIVSPLLLLLAALAVVERGQSSSRHRAVVATLLSLALLGRVGLSSARALHASQVAPTAHVQELRSLLPYVRGQSTVYIGDDDFIGWELYGARLKAVKALADHGILRPEKHWTFGMAMGFDSIRLAVLNHSRWIIKTRDPASSAPYPGLRLVRTTRDYQLWERVAPLQPRSVLPGEGQNPGAILNCHTPAGRALA